MNEYVRKIEKDTITVEDKEFLLNNAEIIDEFMVKKDSDYLQISTVLNICGEKYLLEWLEGRSDRCNCYGAIYRVEQVTVWEKI